MGSIYRVGVNKPFIIHELLPWAGDAGEVEKTDRNLVTVEYIE